MNVTIYAYNKRKEKIVSFVDEDVTPERFANMYGTDIKRRDVVVEAMQHHNMSAAAIRSLHLILLRIDPSEKESAQ